MRIAGVDAGVKGAVAHLDTNDNTLSIFDMPINSDHSLDASDLFDRWLEFAPELVIVEDCFRPNSLLRMVGAIEAVSDIVKAEVRRVAVVTWKKHMLGINTNDKQVSIAKCQQLNPTAELIKPRARTESPDRAEAVLLAYYGRSL